MIDIAGEMTSRTPTEKAKHWLPYVASAVAVLTSLASPVYFLGAQSQQLDEQRGRLDRQGDAIKDLRQSTIPRTEFQYVQEDVKEIKSDVKELLKKKH